MNHWHVAGSVTLCITYISKATTSKERTTFISINALVSTIGFIVGPGRQLFSWLFSFCYYSVNILTVGLSPKYSDSVGVDSVGPRRRPLGHRRTALEHVHIRRLAGCLVNFNIHHLISSLHFPRIRHGRKRGKVE